MFIRARFAFCIAFCFALSLLASEVSAQPACAVPAAFTLSVAPTETLTRPELCRMASEAASRNTDQLVILQRGRPVLEYRSSRAEPAIHIMSVTKSVAVLAVGLLLAEGKLDSLDQPVSTVFPEWRQGRKQRIRVRHLLTHTSGLQDVPNAGAEVEPAPDVVQLALAAELVSDPGERFQYNNKAVNLIAALVQRRTGRDLATYLEERLFSPLGIGDVRWIRDPAGTPYVMAGLHLSATQLARVGQLVLDSGVVDGRQVIPRAFIEELQRVQSGDGPPRGLLWWRHAAGVQANGWLGQWLVLIPESGVVAVRLIDRASYRPGTQDDFAEFAQVVGECARADCARRLMPQPPA